MNRAKTYSNRRGTCVIPVSYAGMAFNSRPGQNAFDAYAPAVAAMIGMREGGTLSWCYNGTINRTPQRR